MTQETHRFFKVEKNTYNFLCQKVDESRNFPNQYAQRGLEPPELLLEDENGFLLIAIDKWRFRPEDELLMQSAIDNNLLIEITREEWLNLKYPPEIIEEINLTEDYSGGIT